MVVQLVRKCCLSWSLISLPYSQQPPTDSCALRICLPQFVVSVLKIITHLPMSKFSKLLLPCTLTLKCRGRAVVIFVSRRDLTVETRVRSHSCTCGAYDTGLCFLWALRSPLSLSFHQYSFLSFYLSLTLYSASKWSWNRGMFFPCVYNCIDIFFLQKWRPLKGGKSFQIKLSLPWATYFHVVVSLANLMFLFIYTLAAAFLSVVPNDTGVGRELHISYWGRSVVMEGCVSKHIAQRTDCC